MSARFFSCGPRSEYESSLEYQRVHQASRRHNQRPPSEGSESMHPHAETTLHISDDSPPHGAVFPLPQHGFAKAGRQTRDTWVPSSRPGPSAAGIVWTDACRAWADSGRCCPVQVDIQSCQPLEVIIYPQRAPLGDASRRIGPSGIGILRLRGQVVHEGQRRWL